MTEPDGAGPDVALDTGDTADDEPMRDLDEPIPGECPSDTLDDVLEPMASTSTLGAGDDISGSCGGDGAEDVTFLWEARADGDYSFDTAGSEIDTILYVLDGECAGDELVCNDDDPEGDDGASFATVTLQVGDVVTIVIDGASPEESGAVSLSVMADPVTDETGSCSDGRDNDGDGDTDCADSDCAADLTCIPPAEDCDNLIDDDGDTAVDCADSDCSGDSACAPPAEDCDNLVDDDGDLDVDCADTDCSLDSACTTPDEICDNAVDDDGDELADCDDPECCDEPACSDAPVCGEFEVGCDDGADPDGDGLIDCADPDCCADSACEVAAACLTVPPDPTGVAPPLDATVATSVHSLTEFLYTGDDPIQRGVAPGTIDPVRVVLVRGAVRNGDGALGGVRIDVLGHRELGMTVTRADGRYDLVVNGGQRLTLRYALDGYVPIQRPLQLPVLESLTVPDVVMTPYDDAVTTIDLSESEAVQVARGSTSTDDDGPRRATLMFSPATSATMTLADGSLMTPTALDVRATELTVGVDGPAAMPAPLPPQSAYTYAVELSADEAVAAGAVRLDFDPAVVFYVENFLTFPAGGIVPVGFYDREAGQWVPSANGRIVEIIDVVAGSATLSIDGDSTAETAEELAALGITAAELEALGSLYTASQTLWRVPISHFTPWDCNWPFGPPPDAEPPPGDPDPDDDDPDDSPDEDDDDEDEDNECREGSIIEIESQSLRQDIELVGTPWHAHYASERMAGRTTAYRIRIPITLAELPTSLASVRAEVEVAGRHFEQVVGTAPNQTWDFEWDGLDAYGRLVEGAQTARIRITFLYPAEYLNPGGEELIAAFNRTVSEAGAASVLSLGTLRAEQKVVISREWTVFIGRTRVPATPVGGWSLTPHHSYDPGEGVLHRGDGTRRAAQAFSRLVETFVGFVGTGFAGDPGPVESAQVDSPRGMAIGPDGAFYFADASNNRVRRIDNETVSTVAGNGVSSEAGLDGDVGDGGPATEAVVVAPIDVDFGPDGSLYIGQINGRLRRVALDGTIETIAGAGLTAPQEGVGGPVADVYFSSIWSFAVAPDGSVYVGGGKVVYRIGTDGIYTRYAGAFSGGVDPFFNDGALATAIDIQTTTGLDVAADGALYFADQGRHMVLRVTPDGRIERVAGDGFAGHTGDGGDARQARLLAPSDLSVGSDGSVYVAELGNYIRRISPEGRITTVAGIGGSHIPNSCGDEPQLTAALGTKLCAPARVLAAPDDVIYFDDGVNGNTERIRRLTPVLPRTGGRDLSVPEADGSEIFIFTEAGRHLRTVDGLTGATILAFGYDGAGRLTSVTDAYDNVTLIERDGVGDPTAIVGPAGHATAIVLTGGGLIESLTDPGGNQYSFAYDDGGLMSDLVDPRTGAHAFEYDEVGRLTRDEDPAGGFVAFDRQRINNRDFEVVETTAEGQVRSRSVDGDAVGGQSRTATFPAGQAMTGQRTPEGGHVSTQADGTVTELVLGPDPRLGMLVPRVASFTLTTPGPRTLEVASTYEVVGGGSGDLFGFDQIIEHHTINQSATFETVYDAATRTVTRTSPLGRQIARVADAQGNLIELQLPERLPITYGYDDRGRLTQVSQGTRTRTLSYNSAGLLETITDGATPVRTVTLSYDSSLRPTGFTRQGTTSLGLAYDANDNPTALTPPGRAEHIFEYTPIDEISAYHPPEVDATPMPTSYTYDLDRRLDEIVWSGPETLSAAYDGFGRLGTLTFPFPPPASTDALEYEFDETTGRLSAINRTEGVSLSYTWDGPLLVETVWSGARTGTLTRGYDNALVLVSEQVNDLPAVTFEYDLDGSVTAAGGMTIARHPESGWVTGTSIGVVTDTFSYNGYGEIEAYSAAAGESPLYDVTYVRDDLGRITERHESVLGGATRTEVYEYDAHGRLASVTEDSVVVASYSYDANGNRFDDLVTGEDSPGGYDEQDRLTAYGSLSYEHDLRGATTLMTDSSSGDETTYTYDGLGILVGVDLPSGSSIAYEIDGNLRRVGRRVDDVAGQGLLYRDAHRPVAELDGSDNVVAQFVYALRDHSPDLIIRGSDAYRVISDQLGSPRLVVDVTDGAVLQELDYDVFGRTLTDTNPGFQPFGFAGGLVDPDTGLIRFGSRDYDPVTGRWTTKDPVLFAGGVPNLYAYVANDPVNQIDPRGEFNPLGILTDPIEAWVKGNLYFEEINEIADEAAEHAYEYAQPLGLDGNVPDALQHCVASCNIAREFGEPTAEAIGLANEVGPGGSLWGDDPNDAIADTWNNSVGQECAMAAGSQEDCVGLCQGAAQAGFLITSWN